MELSQKIPRTFLLLPLAGLVAWVYSPTLNYPFLAGWDDHLYVTQNIPRLEWSWNNFTYWLRHPIAGNYHPLTMWSFMVDYHCWGLNSWGYRWHSMIWHILAVWGVFFSFCKLGINHTPAFVLSVIFAVHPQRVESLVWISERKDTLCASFYFWSLYAYIKSCQSSGNYWRTLSLVLFAGALMAKSMAVSLPIILLCFEWHKQREISFRTILKSLKWYLVLAAVWIPITLWSQAESYQYETRIFRQITVIAYNFIWYLSNYLIPINLSPLYGRISLSIMEIILLCSCYCGLLVGIVYWFRYRRNHCVFSILPITVAYGASLMPIIGVIPIGAIDHADRYSYIPSFFILLPVGWFLSPFISHDSSDQPSIATGVSAEPAQTKISTLCQWGQRHVHALTGVIVIYIFFLVVTTREYLPAWKNLHSLMAWAYETDRPNPVAIGTLADMELQNDNMEKSLQLALELEQMHDDSLNPYHLVANKLKANYLKGACYYKMNQHKLALTYFSVIAPILDDAEIGKLFTVSSVQAMMADSYRLTGNFAQALSLYDLLVAQGEINFELYLNRGVTYFLLENYVAAEKDFISALRFNPEDPTVRHNLEQTQDKLGVKSVPLNNLFTP